MTLVLRALIKSIFSTLIETEVLIEKWRGCYNTVAALLGARGGRPRKIVRVEQRICVVRTDAMSMGASRAFAWTGRLVEAILRDVQESQYGKEN